MPSKSTWTVLVSIAWVVAQPYLPVPERWKPAFAFVSICILAFTVIGWVFAHSEIIQRFRDGPRGSSVLTLIVIGLIGAGVTIALWKFVGEPPASTRAFMVRMGWGSHSGDVPDKWFVLLDSKTPVWGAQLITFTNLLPHPILIESYKVEQQFKGGDWETISIPYDLTRGKVYLGSSETVNAVEMGYVTFDEAVQDKNIAHNESVRGWLLFNVQRRGILRMTVDTPDGSYSAEMHGSASKGWPVQSMLLHDSDKGTPRIDLSKIKLSSFSHPAPTPTPTPQPSSTPSKGASPPSPTS